MSGAGDADVLLRSARVFDLAAQPGGTTKATDFDLRRELQLDPTTGIALFRNSRLVILDASALGLPRQSLVETLGSNRARAFFLRFGYSHGYNDFHEMRKRYSFDSEMALLASGPVIHSWEGIVCAKPIEIRFDRKSGDFCFTGTWLNSYEAGTPRRC